MSRSPVRLLTVAAAAAALVGLTALPALAHVTVNATDATQGGFAVLTFRVPTESDTASTTGIKVQFPADQPLAFASVKPKSGWTYTVTKAKLPTPVKTDDGEVTDYTSVIDWKASTGAGIKPGEFDEFQVSAGPLPKAPSMTFKAIETYSDGKVVSWIEGRCCVRGSVVLGSSGGLGQRTDPRRPPHPLHDILSGTRLRPYRGR